MRKPTFLSLPMAIVCLLIIAGLVGIFIQKKIEIANIANFNECVKAGYPIRESYPAQCSTPNGKVFVQDIIKKQLPPIPSTQPITIQGVVVCLPHKNQNGPQTLECAFGLKDNKGIYYALRDSDPTYSHLSTLPMNKQVKVTGIFTPQEDTKYPTIGVLEIASISL